MFARCRRETSRIPGKETGRPVDLGPATFLDLILTAAAAPLHPWEQSWLSRSNRPRAALVQADERREPARVRRHCEDVAGTGKRSRKITRGKAEQLAGSSTSSSASDRN